MCPFRKLTSPVNHSISPSLNKILNLFFTTVPKVIPFEKEFVVLILMTGDEQKIPKGYAGNKEIHLQEVQNQY